MVAAWRIVFSKHALKDAPERDQGQRCRCAPVAPVERLEQQAEGAAALLELVRMHKIVDIKNDRTEALSAFRA